MKQVIKCLGKVCVTPKGDWDSNKSYERIDLVYNRNDNNSYISKKDVPIGIDINNEEYWNRVTETNISGDIDAKFDELQTSVINNTNDIQKNQNSISETNSYITNLETVLADGNFLVGASNIANSVKDNSITTDMLDDELKLSVSVVDNLTTDNTLMPLSARQGKVLKELIDNPSVATTETPGVVCVGTGLSITDGDLEVNLGLGLIAGNDKSLQFAAGSSLVFTDVGKVDVNCGKTLLMSLDGKVEVNLGTTLITNSNGQIDVNVGTGLRLDNEGKLNIALGTGLYTDDLGKVAVSLGSGLHVDDNGYVEVNCGSGLTMNVAGKVDVNVGTGLHVNGANNVVVALGTTKDITGPMMPLAFGNNTIASGLGLSEKSLGFLLGSAFSMNSDCALVNAEYNITDLLNNGLDISNIDEYCVYIYESQMNDSANAPTFDKNNAILQKLISNRLDDESTFTIIIKRINKIINFDVYECYGSLFNFYKFIMDRTGTNVKCFNAELI